MKKGENRWGLEACKPNGGNPTAKTDMPVTKRQRGTKGKRGTKRKKHSEGV